MEEAPPFTAGEDVTATTTDVSVLDLVAELSALVVESLGSDTAFDDEQTEDADEDEQCS